MESTQGCVKPPSQIKQAGERLHKLIGENRLLCERLREVLVLILKPRPKAPPDPNKEVHCVMSQAAEAIELMANEVDATNALIQEIIADCEL